MTNLFLKAEVDTAIEVIQENINQIIEAAEKPEKRSLTTAEYIHQLKDVCWKSVFREGYSLVGVDTTGPAGDGRCGSSHSISRASSDLH